MDLEAVHLAGIKRFDVRSEARKRQTLTIEAFFFHTGTLQQSLGQRLAPLPLPPA